MKVGYTYNRKASAFKGQDIDPGKLFIDSKATRYSEREDMMRLLKDAQAQGVAVTVVMAHRGDLGRGAGAANFRAAIEAAGARIEFAGAVETDKPSALTDEQQAKYCVLWRDGLLPKAAVLARIEDETGVVLDRHQMAYICDRKPKRQAAKKRNT